jgi:hypothetical protein
MANSIRRSLLIPILCLLGLACLSVDDPVIPNGVNYKKTTDAINESARKKIGTLLAGNATDKDVLGFFQQNAVICGPGLWQQIKADPALAKIENGNVTFAVPVLDAQGKTKRIDKLEGKLFQDDADVLAFWKAFPAKDELKDARIRKLTSDELSIYWSMISFDITEPVFIVESKNHRILMQFTSPDNLRVSWIDDFSNITMKNGTPATQPGDTGK